MEIVEEVNAGKDKISGDAVWALVAKATTIYVASGKKILEFDPATADKSEVLEKVSGRTGNLRAPALRIGSNYYIGYNESLYSQISAL